MRSIQWHHHPSAPNKPITGDQRASKTRRRRNVMLTPPRLAVRWAVRGRPRPGGESQHTGSKNITQNLVTAQSDRVYAWEGLRHYLRTIAHYLRTTCPLTTAHVSLGRRGFLRVLLCQSGNLTHMLPLIVALVLGLPAAAGVGPFVRLSQPPGGISGTTVVPLSPASLSSLAVGATLRAQRSSGGGGHPFSITRLSRRPHVFCLHGLLTDGEIAHILSQGQEMGLQPAATFGDTAETEAELKEAFDEHSDAAGSVDEAALGAVLESLGIEVGDSELQQFYDDVASGVERVTFPAFAGAMIEEDARRKCDIGLLESEGDVIITALNHDITTALLSPEVHTVAFEALHLLEYAAGFAVCIFDRTRGRALAAVLRVWLTTSLLHRWRVRAPFRRGLGEPSSAHGASLSRGVWRVVVPAGDHRRGAR